MKVLVTIPTDWTPIEAKRAWLAEQEVAVVGESYPILAYGSRDDGGASELYVEVELEVDVGEPPVEPEPEPEII